MEQLDYNKVLFVVNSLGKGGAERVVANTANKMSESGYNVTIIMLYNNMFYELHENIRIIYLNDTKNVGKLSKIINIVKDTFKINKLLKELESDGEFNVITSHLPVSNLVCKLSKLSNRCINVIHNVFSAMNNGNDALLKFALRVLYNDTFISTVSKGVEIELVQKYGVKPKKITTIYNPIDIEFIKSKAKEINFGLDKYILFCGRLTQIKRPDILINAFAKGRFNREYKLVFLGEGELRNKLQKQAEDLNIENDIIFSGWQDNVYTYMKNSELLVSCSEFEALPMNILEALACNAKVVSFDCDYGPREILIDELSEYLAEKNNVDDLIDKMNKALSEYPENREKYVLKFSTTNVIKNYVDTAIKWNKLYNS